MPEYANVDGIWKRIGNKFVNVDGVNRSPVVSYTNIDGIWRRSGTGGTINGKMSLTDFARVMNSRPSISCSYIAPSTVSFYSSNDVWADYASTGLDINGVVAGEVVEIPATLKITSGSISSLRMYARNVSVGNDTLYTQFGSNVIGVGTYDISFKVVSSNYNGSPRFIELEMRCLGGGAGNYCSVEITYKNHLFIDGQRFNFTCY